jgi:hypothetical protein
VATKKKSKLKKRSGRKKGKDIGRYPRCDDGGGGKKHGKKSGKKK